MLNISKSTVGDIIRRFKHEDRIESILQRGQPKKLEIIRNIKKDPTLSAPKLADELLTETAKNVHPKTIRRILKESGYSGRVAQKKPFMDEEWCGGRRMNNLNQLQFVKDIGKPFPTNVTVVKQRHAH
ncbi:PREDICTED: uncharacterized protein LOC108578194 [Habropoda laboriosa]|uniref:uncharacterized protein LOC108578194 n=1 Tax=Habropoda laboriosa TaxID=597456 RepID=UPI00083DA371|nr:PREDICTED: uncharacterized protein LOC108578194 [Habropoda laboriosa]